MYTSLLHLSASHSNDEKPYFLRKALMADLSQAAKILVDGFYSDNNTVSKWWEKLQTQMSLESNLPHPYSHPQHEMWVACDAKTGQVLAFCEVDNRPPKKRQQEQREQNEGSKELLVVRPYMCNLAVHVDWRRQGLARDLIRQCESSVELWQDGTYIMFLKVKKHNEAAVKLYTALGYKVTATEFDDKTQDTLLVMQREWTDYDSQDEVRVEGMDSMDAARNEIPMSSSSYEI